MTAALLRFQNLPISVRLLLLLAPVVCAAALWWFREAIPAAFWVLLGAAAVAVVVSLAIVGVVRFLRDRKRAKRLESAVADSSSGGPSMADAAERARADQLRIEFQKGLKKYAECGKDLYKLPWVLQVGEPGSGKTEAIRHSNLSFPPGFDKEFKGVGGTLHMDWWFTNHAVVIDTAGRLMFSDTREWGELLAQLSRARPQCPINGLLLFIAADTLLTDSAEAVEEKAGRIAQQLDGLQRALDIRFPIFVIISKCDKLTGFPHFFDLLEDPELQHQMFGWSNPDDLDAPFRPELIEQHLEAMRQRLLRRRLTLLLDPPTTEDTSQRRIDQVDSLYAFPDELMRLGPRLKRYLETIFTVNEWSAKPLFLRGIYLTSSLQTGERLDKALADMLGVGLAALPEPFCRDRAYFLRDLFMKKVFPERGLVTRAVNATKHYRTTKRLLVGATAAALVAAAGMFWWSMRSFEQAIGEQREWWVRIADQAADVPPIISDGAFAGTRAALRLSEARGQSLATDLSRGRGRDYTLLEVLDRSSQLAQHEIRPPAIFGFARPLGVDWWRQTPSDQVRAAHAAIVRERVLLPIVGHAWAMLSQADHWPEGGAAALAELFRAGHGTSPDVKTLFVHAIGFEPPDPSHIDSIQSAVDHVFEHQPEVCAHAASSMSSGQGGVATWEPAAALDGWVRAWTEGDSGDARLLAVVAALADAVSGYEQAERNVLGLIAEPTGASEPGLAGCGVDAAQWPARFEALAHAKNRLTGEIAQFSDLADIVEHVRLQHENLFRRVTAEHVMLLRAIEGGASAAARQSGSVTQDALLQQVAAAWDRIRKQIDASQDRVERIEASRLLTSGRRTPPATASPQTRRSFDFAARFEGYELLNAEVLREPPHEIVLFDVASELEQFNERPAPSLEGFDAAVERRIVCAIVAARAAQRERLGRRVLAKAPADLSGLRRLVADNAADRSGRALPAIPLSSLDAPPGQPPHRSNPAFDPDAAARLFAGYQAFVDVWSDVRGQTSEVRQDQQAHELLAVLIDRYRDEYCRYWAEVPMRARVRRFDGWAAFHAELNRGLNVVDINHDLATLANAAGEARAIGCPDPMQRALPIDAQMSGGVFAAWVRLPASGVDAADSILSLRPDALVTTLLPSRALRSGDALDYWNSLAMEGLRLLADAAAEETARARARLQRDWRAFPLCRDCSEPDALTPEQIARAQRDMVRLRDALSAGGGESLTVAAGAGRFEPDVQALIDRMRGVSIAADLDASGVAAALRFAEQFSAGELRIQPAEDHRNSSAMSEYRAIEVRVGERSGAGGGAGGGVGGRSTWSRGMGVWSGEPLTVPLDAGPIELFARSGDSPIRASVPGEPLWAGLRAFMASSPGEAGARAHGAGDVRYLEVHVPDLVPVWLRLESTLSPADWPDAANWPFR